MLQKIVTEVAKKEGFKLEANAADLIAIAANGSFRDALGILQKVILASGDKIGSADEVVAIIGAPRAELLRRLVTALVDMDAEAGLSAIQETVDAHVEMKLFMRLLLERVRAVILLRNAPGKSETILAAFGEDDRAHIKSLAEDKASPLNSHLLLRLLEAAEQTGRTQLTHLPLELAVIELCNNAND